MKELDDLITYIENELLPKNCDKKLIHEAICKYAELWHKTQIKKIYWSKFRSTGLVLFINQILHIFGWAIVFEIENNEIKNVYPARVKFRGFDNKDTSEAYKKIGEYMKNNNEQLYKETIK